MQGITRRDFVKGSMATGVVVALPFSRVRGANDDIRAAVVGFNGQGTSHIDNLRELRGVRVVALCEVDRRVLNHQVRELEEKNEKVEHKILRRYHTIICNR